MSEGTDYIFAVEQDGNSVYVARYPLHSYAETTLWVRRLIREYPGATILYREAYDGEPDHAPGQHLEGKADQGWSTVSVQQRFGGV